MRYLLLPLLMLLHFTAAYAQLTGLPIVREGHYPFVKKLAEEGYGLSMEVPGTAEELGENMDRALRESSGNKPKALKKDIIALEGVVLPEISSSRLDYYYRVEETGSKSAPRSRVTFFISMGNYNFVAPNTYPVELEAARRWLAHVPVKARIAELGAMESLRLEDVESAQKEKEGLESKISKIGEDKSRIEEKLAELQAELDALTQEYDQQQLLYDEAIQKQQEKEAELQKVREEIDRLRRL